MRVGAGRGWGGGGDICFCFKNKHLDFVDYIRSKYVMLEFI